MLWLWVDMVCAMGVGFLLDYCDLTDRINLIKKNFFYFISFYDFRII